MVAIINDKIKELYVRFGVAKLFIAICIIFYLLTLLFSIVLGDYSVALVALGGNFIPLVLEGEVQRFLMSAFLHGSIIHLVINMLALNSFGTLVERFYGARKFLITFVLTALTASIVSMIAHLIGAYAASESTFSVSIGASGALFGLVGLIIGNKFKDDTYSIKLENYVNTSQLSLFVIYNLLLGFGFNIIGTSVSIDNWAHLGGFVGGVLLGLFLDPVNTFVQSKYKLGAEKALFYISAISIFAAFIGQILFTLLLFF